MKETKPRVPVRDSCLLGLPLEIRVKIYEHCLVKNHPIDIEYPHLYSSRTSKDRKSLLYVSGQVSAEAIDVLYGKNIFRVSIFKPSDVKFEKAFTSANIQKMRYLQVVIDPLFSLDDSDMEYNGLWFPSVAKLAAFHIVFKTPFSYEAIGPLFPVRQQLLDDTSAEWLGTTLGCIHQQLPMNTTVELDGNGANGAIEVVEKFLPGRSWKLKTSTSKF